MEPKEVLKSAAPMNSETPSVFSAVVFGFLDVYRGD